MRSSFPGRLGVACPPLTALLGVAMVLGLTTLGACRGAPSSPAPAPPAPPQAGEPAKDQAFYAGTAHQQQQALEAIAAFENEEPRVRLDASGTLVRLGERSVPPLLQALLTHPSARTRGMAAYTLGYIHDHRTLDALSRALRDPDAEVQLEAATALLRIGDDRGLARLVAGLEDPNPRVRARSILVLRESVGHTWEFEPDGDPLDRQAAVARWQGWLRERRERAR